MLEVGIQGASYTGGPFQLDCMGRDCFWSPTMSEGGFCFLSQKPNALGTKSLVSRLQPMAGLEQRPPQPAGEMSSPPLSAQALKEMALGTKSIALIAASRRCKDSRDPSPADWRWPHASPSRGHSLDRKAGRKRSPSLTWSLQQVRSCLSGCWGVFGTAAEEGREGK